MEPDERRRVQRIGALVNREVDPRLRTRIRTLVDRQTRLDRPDRPDRPRLPERPSRLKPGEPGPQRSIPAQELSGLLRRAAAGDARRTVWSHRGHEATVRLDSLRAAVADGVLLVALTLDTDQTGPQELTCVFAVGSAKQPAGLLAVAEERPRGHGELAAAFAEPAIAPAWRALLAVVAAVAAAAGQDADGDPLVPAALTATPDGLLVHTIADHHLGSRR